ncbi:MAG: PadR family transcriptional regulator [Leifsonia sp.]
MVLFAREVLVSVRDGLLAVLTLGPAYGAQLHAELLGRLAHRRAVNIGQVYSTLDRLGTQGLVRAAGVTDDGLPLYRITAAGAEEAGAWLTAASPGPAPDWIEMLDAVLMATSLPDVDIAPLVASYRERWSTEPSSTLDEPQSVLARQASALLAAAALDWLTSVETADAEASDGLGRGYSAERPRRGRRPAA